MKDTNNEQIIAYLRNPEGDVDLTEKQKELLTFYVDAYAMLRNYESIPDTINVLVKISHKMGKPISAATARRYINDAVDVIGMASEIKREGIRNLSAEIIRDAIRIAKEDRDAKTMIQGAKELAALFGSNDPEAPNFDLLEPHLYQILLDPEAMKIIQLLTQRGPLDLDSLMGNVMNSMAEDIEIQDERTGD